MSRTDRNGYAKSIMGGEDGTCWLCGYVGDTARHEIYGGANRKVSKANGFWVPLCPRCHDIAHRIEDVDVKVFKVPCQKIYLRTHTREEFYKLIGRFYDADR